MEKSEENKNKLASNTRKKPTYIYRLFLLLNRN